jgi:hypothetical protein
MSALPHFSDVDLLRYGKRIIDLNSEITDCTLDFGVAAQKLNYSKISGFLMDQSCLGPTQ